MESTLFDRWLLNINNSFSSYCIELKFGEDIKLV